MQLKIKSFQTEPAVFPSVCFDSEKPVCFFVGAGAFLQLMRCLLDGEDEGTLIDEEKDRVFVSRVAFEKDGESYELCGVLCDDQTFFSPLPIKTAFSLPKPPKS